MPSNYINISRSKIQDLKRYLEKFKHQINLVWFNGIFISELSTSSQTNFTVEIIKKSKEESSINLKHLKEVLEKKDSLLEDFNTYFQENNFLLTLNETFKIEKIKLSIKEELSKERINLIFLNDYNIEEINEKNITNKDCCLMASPHLEVEVKENSSVCLVEYYDNINKVNKDLSNRTEEQDFFNANLVNVRIDFKLEELSKVSHGYINELSEGNDQCIRYVNVDILGEQSIYESYVYNAGSKASILQHKVTFQALNSKAFLKGLCLSSEEQRKDNIINIEHKKGHCYSEQLYKNAVKDNGEVHFTGKVKVNEGAIQTHSSQLVKNLLMDEGSTKVRPQLVILNDDVKCSHGATTGNIDEEALFYLKSRGISLKEANKLLIDAFSKGFLKEMQERFFLSFE